MGLVARVPIDPGRVNVGANQTRFGLGVLRVVGEVTRSVGRLSLRPPLGAALVERVAGFRRSQFACSRGAFPHGDFNLRAGFGPVNVESASRENFWLRQKFFRFSCCAK